MFRIVEIRRTLPPSLFENEDNQGMVELKFDIYHLKFFFVKKGCRAVILWMQEIQMFIDALSQCIQKYLSCLYQHAVEYAYFKIPLS